MILSKLFGLIFTKTKSLETIVAPMQRIVAELDDYIETHADIAMQTQQEIARLEKKVDAHAVEAARGEQLRARYTSLIAPAE